MEHNGAMEMSRRAFLAAAGLGVLAGCAAPIVGRNVGSAARPDPTSAPPTTPATTPPPSPTEEPPPTRGTAAEILARSSVPVLCFHQLREHTAADSEYAKSITTPPGIFAAQLRAVKDAGYEAISGAALADFLEFGEPALPERPVLITFDDGSRTHYSVGLPTLQDLGWVGTFFPMTVVLNKKDWLTDDHLREMADAGMTIGAHTWDHQRLDKLPADQWELQAAEPRAELARITGQEVDLLAYPYGVWNQEALPRVVAAGYRAAFQLFDPQDAVEPLLTIRRLMPPPTWSGATLVSRLETGWTNVSA